VKVGDYVIPSGSVLWEYFPNGPRKIKAIREVGGPYGDAVSLKGIKRVEFWSNYLRVIQ
jgi:hypothetical protein